MYRRISVDICHCLYSFISVFFSFYLFTTISAFSWHTMSKTSALIAYLGNLQVPIVITITHENIQMIFENRPLASQGVPNLFKMLTHQHKQHAEFACGELANGVKKDSKWCCDTATPESIHTKDESKRGSAFAFIFGVN